MPYSDQVDAAPVRRHVQALLDGGMSIAQIEALSGVNRTAIRVLLGAFPNRKQSTQVRELTASRLLRTRLDRGATVDGLVPAIGTRRRLQALYALGYTQRDLAERLGCAEGSRGIQIGRHDLVRAERALEVAALYDELSGTLGPSSRTREYARNRGWLPPAWWDDETIDDPLAEPEGARTYIYGGRVLLDDVTLPRSVRVEQMTKLGLSAAEIADRIGTPERYVLRDRLEHAIDVPSTPPAYLGGKRPPRNDVDEVAVQRAVAGDPPESLTPAERREVVRILHERGMNDRQIHQLAGMAHETAGRIRRELGLPAIEPEPGLSDQFSARGAHRRRSGAA